MQRLQLASKQEMDMDEPQYCAKAILEAVPTVFQFIRSTANRRRAKGLSVQQFRAMAYLLRRPGHSLSMLAEYLGLSLAATSRLIESLVHKGLVDRQVVPSNRRQVRLASTARGEKLLAESIHWTEGEITRKLQGCPAARRKRIIQAVRDLQEIFQM